MYGFEGRCHVGGGGRAGEPQHEGLARRRTHGVGLVQAWAACRPVFTPAWCAGTGAQFNRSSVERGRHAQRLERRHAGA
ncbi:hypothetical protein, partial [Burkholderia glumae]